MGAAVKVRVTPSRTASSGPGVFVFLTIGLSLAWLVAHRIADPDIWQHLTVGRTIWDQRAVPATHLWTWPRLGEPEVLPSWLFRALLWPFHASAGDWGLQAWRWLMTLGTFGLAALTARRMGARGLVPWLALVLAALVYRQRSEVRPETLAALLLAAQMFALERARGGETRALIAVPMIALLWANAHVSFWMGWVVTALHLGDALLRERRIPVPLTIAFVASVACSLVNPFGIETLAQPFVYQLTLRNDPLYRTIAELHSVDWSRNLWNGLPLLVAGWPLLALVRSRRAGPDRIEWILLVMFIGLGLTTQRFVGFLAVVAAPYLIRDLSERVAAVRKAPLPAWPRAAVVALLTLGMVTGERAHSGVSPGIGIETRYLPVGALDYMQRAGVRGRGFNEFWQGGYLLWRFWPERERLPFMDIHQSGSPGDRALVARLGRDPLAFHALDREHHFEWVLTSGVVELTGGFPDQLDADSTWRLVFYDDAALLYVRRAGPLAALAERDGYRWLPGGLAALPAIGARAALDTLTRHALRLELERAVSTSPAHAGLAHMKLANLALQDGRTLEALRQLDAALASGVDVPGLRERRARVAASVVR